MDKIQEWVEKNSEELSVIASFHQMTKDEVIEKVLGTGLQACLDEVADAVAQSDY
jgi:DNA-directed RNA polymerase alpha subunit